MFLSRIFKINLILILFSLNTWALDFKEAASKARDFAKDQNHKEAINTYEKLKDEDLSARNKSLKHFALAKLYQDENLFDKSLEHLSYLQKNEFVPEYYRQYLLGHAFKMKGQYDKAMKAYAETLKHDPSRNIIYDAKFEFSEMAMQLGKPNYAYKHLKYLERRWRGTIRHPEVVWRLTQVELAKNRKWRACRWARKMYSSYSGHELVKHWGADLQKNTINDKELGCVASSSDLKRRVKRLQLYGQAQRARDELNILVQRAPASVKHEVDTMMAEFLISQGYPDEALSTLILHYEKLKDDFDYQSLLAKTSSKAAEYPTAIGAYYKAYQMKPRSSDGRRALFSAAFLSYQSQDYDGATRKFQELIKKNPRSGLARDANWHLAWLRYLKKDYEGAQYAFEKLLNKTYRYGRRRRRYRPFNNDRTRYWLAMSYLKLEKKEQAKALFEKIATNKYFSYYSILSEERLSSFEGYKMTPRGLASTELALEETQNLVELEAESEDTLSETNKMGPEADEVALNEQDEGLVTAFQNPKLQKRFDTAHMLIELGLYDWARFELYEIEKRTRNKDYLRMLMQAYQDIGSYNRSLYISETYFSKERHSGGLEGAKQYWSWNFPYGYKEHVDKYSKSFGVPESLILSIMRAESHFYQYAISPVGARGLMQLMPYTAKRVAQLLNDKDFSDEELSTPELNIRYGSRYLQRLSKQFQGMPLLVAAAYNAGPHRVKSWLNNFGSLQMDEFVEHIPFVETRNYAKKVLRHYLVYNRLYNSNSKTDISWMMQPIPVKVANRPSPRENWGTLD